MSTSKRFCCALSAVLLLASCASEGDDRADTPERYGAIAADETLTLVGAEPFWTMVIEGESLIYSTPEDADGGTITVSRFAGNNGLGFNGEWQGEPLQIAVTPGVCSDGMSDREFPYTATIILGDATLFGCGYTGDEPTSGTDETM